MCIGCLPEKPEPSNYINISMLNLEVCKRILNRNEEKYSDEQIKDISEFVAMLADVWVNHQLKDSQDEENCSHLYQGINGHPG